MKLGKCQLSISKNSICYQERRCWREGTKVNERMTLLQTEKSRGPVSQELKIKFGLTCKKDTFIHQLVKCLEKAAV